MSEASEDKELTNTKFKVSIRDMMDLIDTYRQRKFDEDIKCLKNVHGGPEGLAEKLCTNTKTGIVPNDLEERDLVFGSNKKKQAKRSNF